MDGSIITPQKKQLKHILTSNTMKGKEDARNYKPGDILNATFHYSAQTPEFYVVVRNTGKTVFAEKLEKMYHAYDRYGQEGVAVPDVKKRTGEVESSRIRISEGRGYIRLNDSYTRLWDGRPVEYYGD